MEAIMKAFERMEKTEKRRQQALERIAQKHGSDVEGGDKASVSEVRQSPVKQEAADSSSSVSAAVATSTTSPVSAPAAIHPEESAKANEGANPDEQKPQPAQKRKAKKPKASSTPNKRRLRTASGSSDQSAIMSSADESGYITSFGVPSTPNTAFTADPDTSKGSPGGSNCPFRFPKTKKVSLFLPLFCL